MGSSSHSHPLTVIETCRVSPPPDTTADKSLPLTFFDYIWLPVKPLCRVIFYEFPHSTAYFTQNHLPILKTSLSLALKHFYPFAGNLVKPIDIVNSKADLQIRYLDGDSVSVTFVEYTCDTHDFNELIGNHARDADILNPFVPQLPPATRFINESGEEFSVNPLFAIQVTVFPNRAICFGLTNSHVAADGGSVFNFVKAWSSIAQKMIGTDGKVDINEIVESAAGSDFQIPSYDRSLVKDPLGVAGILRKALGGLDFSEQAEQNVSAGSKSVRATFILNQAAIQALKNKVMAKCPNIPYVSSFTVVFAYIINRMAKVRAAADGEDKDENLNFGFAVDCRARLNPPLPASYFGNCLIAAVAKQTRKVIAGEEGFFIAAESVGKALFDKLNNNEGGVMKGADKWLEVEYGGAMKGEWFLGVAGSPKLDYYNTVDFGMGEALKFEFVTEPFSVSRCKDSKADLELGVILPKNDMDVFSTVFAQGLPNSSQLKYKMPRELR